MDREEQLNVTWVSVHATDDNASGIYILNGLKGGQLYNGSNFCKCVHSVPCDL